jgi:hypothetical protein
VLDKLPGIEIFGEEPFLEWYCEWRDKGYERGQYYYWYVYFPPKLSREKRNNLKSLGWKLQRHPLTNKEIWLFNNQNGLYRPRKFR